MPVELSMKRMKMPYFQMGLWCLLGGLAVYGVVRTEMFVSKVETLKQSVDNSTMQLDRAAAHMDEASQLLAEKAVQPPPAVAVVAPPAKDKPKPVAHHSAAAHDAPPHDAATAASHKPAAVAQAPKAPVAATTASNNQSGGLLHWVGSIFEGGSAPMKGPAPVVGNN